jgi:hypothetical protein
MADPLLLDAYDAARARAWAVNLAEARAHAGPVYERALAGEQLHFTDVVACVFGVPDAGAAGFSDLRPPLFLSMFDLAGVWRDRYVLKPAIADALRARIARAAPRAALVPIT